MNINRGFSLLELMIAVAVIGLLAAVAYPSYLAQMQDARRADGQAALMDIAARQERFFYDRRTFAAAIGNGANQLNAPATSAEGYYNLSIVNVGGCNLPDCFIARAQATGAQAGDFNLLIDSRGNRKLDADGDNFPDANEENW